MTVVVGLTSGSPIRPSVSHQASGHQAKPGAWLPRYVQRGRSLGLKALLRVDP